MVANDVIVVGAGPTGLLLAGDLARAGHRVTVFDQLAQPSTTPKANAVVGQAARLLWHRGIHRRLGLSQPPPPPPMFQFGGLPLDLSVAPADALHGMRCAQPELESALAARAREAGVRIRRSCRVVDVLDARDTVTVHFRDEQSDDSTTAHYLVGCDGAHSRVREAAGIEFPGVTDGQVVSRSADVLVAGATVDPARAEVDIPGAGTFALYSWNRTERGAWSMLPKPDGTTLVSAMEWPTDTETAERDDDPVTLAEVSAALDRVVGTHLPVRSPSTPAPHQLRRWRGRNTRIASAYRRGRVFLAGDAAHVHNAVGAPGLNIGLQDAACLAWRLTASLRGSGGVLDDYECERRPAAARVAVHTQAQTLLLSPGGPVTSLRTLMGELLDEPAVVARLARMLEGSDVTYPAGPGEHALVGRFVPDVDGIDALVDDSAPTLVFAREYRLAAPPGVITAELPVGAPMLIRPDGYVAWACDRPDPVRIADLHRIAASMTGHSTPPC